MSSRSSFVALTFLVVLCLVLSGAGCTGPVTSIDDLDTNQDGTITDEEIGPALAANDRDDKREMTFAHVKPGEYSEVYLKFLTQPGGEIEATLRGPSVVAPATQTLFADDDGFIRFVWRVRSLGRYTADVFRTDRGAIEILFSESVTVE